MPDLVAPKAGGAFEQQFRNIVDNSLDRRRFVDVVAPDAGDEIPVGHGLGYVPVGFIVINASETANVWTSDTAWDTEAIYLKSDASNGAHLRIMIF